MTRRHKTTVVTTNRWGMKRRRVVTRRGHLHDRAQPGRPPALRPQVRRAGRNAQRGYRAHRRGHTWRRDALVTLAVAEFVIALAFGTVEAVLFLVGVLLLVGFVTGRTGHRRATKANARRRASKQGAAT